ncbi:MAG: hypothetical protein ABJB33_08235 [Gemmatimonadota bacterium]
MPSLPSKFDRAQLDRILQRAAELQAGERDPGEQLNKEELLQLGRDVGIPGKFLEQAVLEEQTRLPAQRLDGFWDRAAGPAALAAMRVVRGGASQIERAFVDYMEEEELLTVARQSSGRIQWEPLKGFNAAMRRSKAILGGGTKPFMLARALSASASVTPLEPGFVHVTIEADVREARGQFIGGAAAFASLGLAAGIVIGVLGAPFLALAPIPLGLGLGWGVLRRYAPVYQRTQMGLERALDRVERGEVKPPPQIGPGASIVGAVLAEVRKAISSR